MQTFLPYSNFWDSADCLDWRYERNRLNNQVNEGLIILETLLKVEGDNFKNHPVVRMWRGWEGWLILYTSACLKTWMMKKHITVDLRTDKIFIIENILFEKNPQVRYYEPEWLGDERLHSCHRSILLAKSPEWYAQFNWKEQPAHKDEKGRWPYYWPVK